MSIKKARGRPPKHNQERQYVLIDQIDKDMVYTIIILGALALVNLGAMIYAMVTFSPVYIVVLTLVDWIAFMCAAMLVASEYRPKQKKVPVFKERA